MKIVLFAVCILIVWFAYEFGVDNIVTLTITLAAIVYILTTAAEWIRYLVDVLGNWFSQLNVQEMMRYILWQSKREAK